MAGRVEMLGLASVEHGRDFVAIELVRKLAFMQAISSTCKISSCSSRKISSSIYMRVYIVGRWIWVSVSIGPRCAT